ncbi:bifunctional homocysteine S-methyltransferase/methylenetetrahydrofolate reductase [Actinokineospora sp.]|uniref:bifunctional homocysteine S-methyltransferase/methylenetetrahydrofolate reductase n=1 Tax=Actinokineospora sp. TaxID=1872133 RepID=UPI0040377A24
MDHAPGHGARSDSPRARMRERFAGRIVVCDGAMGTMLHSAGVPLDRSLCELNLTQPGLVRDVHAAYLAAGAQILQTNTFHANRMRLTGLGLEDRVVEINIAGARLAREIARAAPVPALVAGSVGPATSAPSVSRVSATTRADTVREQVAALADWVDLIVLETFGDIESLTEAVRIALAETDLPVIAQMTFGDDGRTLRGESPEEAAAALAGLDVAAIGANCTVGPAVLTDVVAALAAHSALPVSVQPNAGVPGRSGQSLRYAHNVDYFAEAAAQFVAGGATVIGGCCGTTPAHVRAIAAAVRPLTPLRRKAKRRASVVPQPDDAGERVPVAWPLRREPTVIVGLRAPNGPRLAEFVETAETLTKAGATTIAISEPAPPMARINPVGGGVLLSERVGVEVVLVVETSGRNLAALQADLLGAHALGLRTVVCRTGSVRVTGDYPEPGSPLEVDSVRLVAALAGLNDGVDWRGVATPHRTRFVVGAAVRTSPVDLDREVARVAEKVRAGAHFLVTDPIHDAAAAQATLTALRESGVDLPIVGTVAPFEDPATLRLLRNEIPGSTLSISALADARRAIEDPDWAVRNAVRTAERLGGLLAAVMVSAPACPDARLVELIGRLAERAGPG